MEKDKTVAITVIRRLPIGLLVRMENGEEGIIRVRETSWDVDDRQRWQELYPEDWTGRAVLLGERKGGRPELSLRLASKDPWDGVPGRYRRGQTVRGVVSGVMKYGVFVDISTGITGLLHVSDLPGPAHANPLDLFWPGDHLLVSILAIDLNRRRISLGPAHGRADIETAAPSAGKDAPAQDLRLERETRPALERQGIETAIARLARTGGQRHILVIEDDEDQAAVLSNWFTRIGYRVDVRTRGQSGLQAAEQDPPDLAVVDLTLPDMLGAHTLRSILDAHPGCRGVLITDWARADEYVKELEALQAGGVTFLLKPILPSDLAEILHEDEAPLRKPSPGEQPLRPEPRLPAPPRPELGRTKTPTQTAIRTKLQNMLKECQETLRFDLAALFALDPVQRTMELICASGEASSAGLMNPDRTAALVFSPVRDAAEDGDEVVLETLREHDLARFRYLLEFFPLQACCGVRVPVSGQKPHALFLLHCTPRSISPEAVVYSRGASLAIGAALDRQMFLEHAVLVQRTALLGHLTRGLVHEINHQIGPLSLTIEDLQAILSEMKEGVDSPNAAQNTPARIQEALEQAADMQRSVTTLINTTRQFGRIITRPKEEFLRVDEPIENAIKLLREISDRSRVRVHFRPPAQLTLVRSQGAVLEQILINLLLNAIQQIRPRPNETGWVQVRVETRRAQDGEKIQIRVEDNGPGIHLRQWEQVFDVGYTTREDGSGMGLYISRSLVETLGGKLYVEESYILGGSVFLLEIPANV